jgi:hypothetical protein
MCSMSDVLALLDSARAAAARVEPDALTPGDATRQWQAWSELARLAQGAATLLARRVADCAAWQAAGFRSAAEAVAAATGTSVAAARTILETSEHLRDLEVVAGAVRAGALSAPKIEAVVAAAAVAPDQQSALVATAASTSLHETREACSRVRAAAEGDEAYERVRRDRQCREWHDPGGGWNLHARGPLDGGNEIRATLDAIVGEVFANARASGEREPREAYAFDALVLMARRARGAEPAPATSRDRKPLGILRVDLAALQRGQVEGDELCELAGLGPIPVARARELLGDAVLKLVITRGTDVAHVTHLGRGPTAAQRVALLWESPQCRVAGCHSLRLEIDHRTPWAQTRQTRLRDLDPLCTHHHALKTHGDWALVPGTGRRPLVPPTDPRHPRHRRLHAQAREPA